MRRALATLAVGLSATCLAAPAGGDEAPTIAVTGAGSPSIEVEVSAKELRLGEPFFATLRARHASDVQVVVPDALALGPGLEELGRASASRRNPDGTVTRETELELIAFEVGEVPLPPIELQYVTPERSGQVWTEEVVLAVRDPLAGTGDAQLRDLAEPVSVSRTDLTWLFAGAAALIAAAAAAFVRHLRRRVARGRRRRAPERAAPDPAGEALARLETLAASGALDAVDRRPAYYEMSEIVRGYLGRLYGFPALDLTTKEIRGALERAADDESRRLVLGWLADVDAVKYAGYGAGTDEARDTLDRAVELVLETQRAGDEPEEV